MPRSLALLCLLAAASLSAQTPMAPAPAAAPPPASTKMPTDAKAVKTFQEASGLMKDKRYTVAEELFLKADKQDGGHCLDCKVMAYKAARQVNDFKTAREQAEALLASVNGPADKALVHTMLGETCLAEGIADKKDKPFEEADQEFRTALELQPTRSTCLYSDGLALAHLKQDGPARERFQQYLAAVKPDDLDYPRAQRFVEHPELARARIAPNFRLTTLDGKTITLESLTGKVVLLDFWATWCGPCREALPYVRKLAQKYQDQPFVVLSISIDKDEDAAKWKDFIAKNQMTWLQYRDGAEHGPLAKMFGVEAIPSTFTIDADGVLQDQHVGDADLEGKIKKLLIRANELAAQKGAPAKATGE